MKIAHGNAASFQDHVDQEWSSNPVWPFKAGYDFFGYDPDQSLIKDSVGWKNQLLVRSDGSLIDGSGPAWGFAAMLFEQLCRGYPAFETSDILAEYAAFIERLLGSLEILRTQDPIFSCNIWIARLVNDIGTLMVVHDWWPESGQQFKPYDYAIYTLMQVNEYVSALSSSEDHHTILSYIARTFIAGSFHPPRKDEASNLVLRGIAAMRGSKSGGDVTVYARDCESRCITMYASMLLTAHSKNCKLPTQKKGAEYIHNEMRENPETFDLSLVNGVYQIPPTRRIKEIYLKGVLSSFKSQINAPKV